MLLGYNTNGFAHHRLEDAVTILAELGYESIAITLDHSSLNPFLPLKAAISNFRALLEKLRIHCVIETGARFLVDPRQKHQPTLISPDEKGREERLSLIMRAILIGQALEADAVSFWSGAALDQPGEIALWDRLVDGCRFLSEFAEKRRVRLAFEPEPGMFIDSMARFSELKERVAHPLFGLAIDIGHLHCQGEIPIPDPLRPW